MKEIALKMNRNKKCKIANSPSILKKKSLEKFSEHKKIDPEIWSQKYPLGPTSWRPFLKKVTLVVRF